MNISFYWYAWIAAISSGFMVIMEKLTSKYTISNPWLFNFLLSFFILLFILPLALMNNVGLPHYWNGITLAAFFGSLFGILYILALYHLDVTVLSPLLSLRGVFGVILGVVFLGEVLKLNQIILISIIILGGIFVTIDEKFRLSSFIKPAVFVVILATLALALNGFFINRSATQITYWELTLWQCVISQLILLTTIPFFIKDLKRLNRKQILTTALIAFIFIGYNLAANKAFTANVGISSVIISFPASMIIAFILSIFAPKLLEKHTLKVYFIRFFAAAIMIFAALKLSG